MLNDPLKHAAESSLSNRFEKMATLFHDNLALVSDTETNTYGQLNDISNKLANALLNSGLMRGERVALLMSHDTQLFVGMLSILKAGMVVVTLSPSDPVVRLQTILEDAAAAAILSDSAHLALAEELVQNEQLLLHYEMHEQMGVANNPGLAIDPSSMAFLIYTSGTTGHPKGVIQSHRNVLHNALRLSMGMQIQPQDRILLLGALSSGQGISTTWCAFSNGARLCPYPVKIRGLADLAHWITEKKITIYVSSASLFRTFMKTLLISQRLPTVRLVRLGSEAATDAEHHRLQQHFSSECVLFNSLSSSETGNITQLRLYTSDITPSRLPIGFSTTGINIILLKADGNIVTPGDIGEIVVQSDYLSPGYWRNPDLTVHKYREITVGNHLQRVFFTGDLGWYDQQGQLNYLGRRDHQIKIRGFRVELFEIEQALTQIDGVEAAVANICNRNSGEPQLIAYIVLNTGHDLQSTALRDNLLGTLPDYMVPTSFVMLPDFPLNAHGKIDRKALSIMDRAEANTENNIPQPGLETILERIWAEALDRESIASNASFFDLGGDSLSAMLIAAKVRQHWNIELRLRLFAENSTLSAMAAWLENQLVDVTSTVEEPISVADRSSLLPVSFIQERVWQESQTVYGSAGYVISACYQLKGPLDRDCLQLCIDFLANRHEILRTTFHISDGQLFCRIHPPQSVELNYLDFSDAAKPENQSLEYFNQYAERLFNLERGPLVLFSLIRLGDTNYRLQHVHHHIISDGWSWKIYFEELASLYVSIKCDETSSLPIQPALQYADYAAWQRQNIATGTGELHVCIEWWKKRLAHTQTSLILPFQRKKPNIDASPESGYVSWDLTEANKGNLENIVRNYNLTHFVLRLAAFIALLSNETGQQQLTIGTYITHRNRTEWQSMFGFFADLVMLRFNCDKQLSFCHWLEVVGKVLSEAEAHAGMPYQKLCEELILHQITPPIISALFVDSSKFKVLKFADMELSIIDRYRKGMPWGFTLATSLQQQNDEFETRFDAGLHDPEKVAKFMQQYLYLLAFAGRFPDYSLSYLIRLAKLKEFCERSKRTGKRLLGASSNKE
jgi:amino acid adenylation domain-containing protein